MYRLSEKEIFHVHTYRCMHAGEEKDYQYIEKAISIGAESIIFTDHAPFPDNLFGNRMPYVQLEEYVSSLKKLREKYKTSIQVKIGLEIEFLPSYIEYYKKLKDSKAFDVLMIGQHFYEIAPREYSFSMSPEENKQKEFIGCGQAIVEGITTGIFDVVAHPDRIFRRRKEWTGEMETISKHIIEVAKQKNVYLEKNAASIRNNQYWEEFWQLVPEDMVIYGLDAHSTKELE